MEFGELLRSYREEAGFSQNALARAAGIDPTSLNRTEHGRQGPPRRSTVVKLVRGFGWSLTDPRASALFTAARLHSGSPNRLSATLASPLRIERGRHPSLQPTLRKLKLALLNALEAIEELEELARADDANEEQAD
jgi:transcriptional regulator with XRE-family HTH domain